MKKNNKELQKKKNISLYFWGIIIFFMIIIYSTTDEPQKYNYSQENIIQNNEYYSASTFRIISSQENKNLENIITEYANSKGYDISIEYSGTLDIVQRLNSGEKFDAVWISNSIWSYMLNSSIKLSNSKCTSITPVVFGIKKSKAIELGFADNTIYTKDIVNAIQSGNLKFSMSNPTITNSGASAYLGMLSVLTGNPEVLTKDMINDESLKENLIGLFSGMERSSGDEDFLEELFLNGDYEAVVTYESSIIDINKELVSQGKEPLYAIYPVDGVSISDSPFGYIDNKNQYKKEIFNELQSYILSNEGQNKLQEYGKRTWYGGVPKNIEIDKNIFNPDWGIDTTRYITPIKYPSSSVIQFALNLYQTELRKPIHVVFCLDYSGSMTSNNGDKELLDAMNYVLTEEAAKDLIQFSNKDKIDVIPFSDNANNLWSTPIGTETQDLLQKINSLNFKGMTALFPACQNALELLQTENTDDYNLSIIVMTDGEGNVGSYETFVNAYNNSDNKIPIYAIKFANANEAQLNQLTSISNGKVFDGRLDLVKAFKEVRGYN